MGCSTNNNPIVDIGGTSGVGGGVGGGRMSGGNAARLKLMTMLLARPEVDVNELLLDSCRRSETDSLSLILLYGANADRVIIDTCERGDDKVLELLLAHPIDSAVAVRALATAAECAHVRCVRLLVQAGVPVVVALKGFLAEECVAKFVESFYQVRPTPRLSTASFVAAAAMARNARRI